jgi:hypothetical protein
MVHHYISAMVNKPTESADMLLKHGGGVKQVKNTDPGHRGHAVLPGLVENSLHGKVYCAPGIEGHARHTLRAEHHHEKVVQSSGPAPKTREPGTGMGGYIYPRNPAGDPKHSAIQSIEVTSRAHPGGRTMAR